MKKVYRVTTVTQKEHKEPKADHTRGDTGMFFQMTSKRLDSRNTMERKFHVITENSGWDKDVKYSSKH